MTTMAGSPSPLIDIESLGFDAGAHLLVRHALDALMPGQTLRVVGAAPGWEVMLEHWCRSQGHLVQWQSAEGRRFAVIERDRRYGRWRDAQQTGRSDSRVAEAVVSRASPAWGLAARGAQVEAGSPEFVFRLDRKAEVWSENAADLYAQAVAAQWDPDEAIDWLVPFELPSPVEAAIVQIMTYLVENENAALIVPARFLGQLHPHYRELQAALAIQLADEARHIEVFTRRIRHKGHEPALSTAGGQASLKTLLDEPDFSVASFLLSVMGEGTFVTLLQFLQSHAPDPLTRQIARLAARDEARHVALGMSHLLYRLKSEPRLRSRLAHAVEQRHDALEGTAGLNEEVFDALILIAAAELTPAAVARGYAQVQTLMREMADGRYTRLVRLGFEQTQAKQLAALHTRNFM
ncbi:ferritin-like domain-containing protein [Paraburkholderia sp. CNPSo 3274]|uniref:ferritin-like domain-containing protein n=1 Tax=Paraburkholderia sp. CNPSo 3274 TaxID=2940932 RepID=UPI0020B6A492|nr:ferritin-like domain-containing protein [Paraburkholderia sp. CNPSo 3274]MCP3711066.1 ferritin-like domain-containing protein [Paraburkholderia sp. CNPSo 3274]